MAVGAPRGMTYRKESGMSDHEAFEKAGFPSVWIEDREPSTYHQPTDVASGVPAGHVANVGAMLQELFESYLTPERVDQL